MRPRPVVGKATIPEAVRRLLDKFDYPDRETEPQLIPVLPSVGGSSDGTGAYVHLTRNTTQSIASGGEAIEWDTLGLQGLAVFIASVPTTTVTIPQAGYYDVGIQLGWQSFEGGGTVTVLRNGTTVWPPTDDPGLWSTDDGQLFEGTAHALPLQAGDLLSVNLNPDDASAQTLVSATLAAYLVDRVVNESLYGELVLSHGPLAYWRLDETSGTNADDIAGHASGPFDATYSGATLNQSGVMTDGSGSPSISLDGVNDRAEGADWSAMDFAGTALFTLEAWITTTLPADAADLRHIIGKHEFADDSGWELYVHGDGAAGVELSFLRKQTPGEDRINESGLLASTTYHVVATYDGATMRLYVNGIQRGSLASSSSITANTIEVWIGAEEDTNDTDTPGFFWDGKLDEVAVYDRALTSAEILEHYTVGSS